MQNVYFRNNASMTRFFLPRSKEFGLPMNRGRLYFIGAELVDITGEPTGNSEATLDRVLG
jgi:hypothetical protein